MPNGYSDKVYFRFQILERKCRVKFEYFYVSKLLTIGQFCHVLDFINIPELGNTGTKCSSIKYYYII